MSKNTFLIVVAGLIVSLGAGFLASGKGAFIPGIFKGSSPESLASELKGLCTQNQMSKETCYSKEFKKVAKDNGAEYSFRALAILQSLDPDAIGCHLIAHGIGSGTYEHDPEDWQNQLRSINQSCNYGAMHGIIENYIGSLPDKKLTEEIMLTICGTNPRADCNHIVGHLTLVETRGNVEDALKLCQIFTDDYQREFCLTGVFMEHQTALNLIEHGYAPKSWLNWPARVDELAKMCRSQSGENAIACWEEIVHAALVKFHNDPKTIFDFCSTSQVSEGSKKCRRHSIGIMAAGKNFEIDTLKSMCLLPQKNDPSFEGDCYVQLVSSMLSTIPQAKDKAEIFCNGLDKNYQPACLAQVSGIGGQQIRGND